MLSEESLLWCPQQCLALVKGSPFDLLKLAPRSCLASFSHPLSWDLDLQDFEWQGMLCWLLSCEFQLCYSRSVVLFSIAGLLLSCPSFEERIAIQSRHSRLQVINHAMNITRVSSVLLVWLVVSVNCNAFVYFSEVPADSTRKAVGHYIVLLPGRETFSVMNSKQKMLSNASTYLSRCHIFKNHLDTASRNKSKGHLMLRVRCKHCLLTTNKHPFRLSETCLLAIVIDYTLEDYILQFTYTHSAMNDLGDC